MKNDLWVPSAIALGIVFAGLLFSVASHGTLLVARAVSNPQQERELSYLLLLVVIGFATVISKLLAKHASDWLCLALMTFCLIGLLSAGFLLLAGTAWLIHFSFSHVGQA